MTDWFILNGEVIGNQTSPKTIENYLLKVGKSIKLQLLVFSNCKVEINFLNGTKFSYSATQQVIMQLLDNLWKIRKKMRFPQVCKRTQEKIKNAKNTETYNYGKS